MCSGCYSSAVRRRHGHSASAAYVSFETTDTMQTPPASNATTRCPQCQKLRVVAWTLVPTKTTEYLCHKSVSQLLYESGKRLGYEWNLKHLSNLFYGR